MGAQIETGSISDAESCFAVSLSACQRRSQRGRLRPGETPTELSPLTTVTLNTE